MSTTTRPSVGGHIELEVTAHTRLRASALTPSVSQVGFHAVGSGAG
jgi:hypothetical protein